MQSNGIDSSMPTAPLLLNAIIEIIHSGSQVTGTIFNTCHFHLPATAAWLLELEADHVGARLHSLTLNITRNWHRVAGWISTELMGMARNRMKWKRMERYGMEMEKTVGRFGTDRMKQHEQERMAMEGNGTDSNGVKHNQVSIYGSKSDRK